MGVIYNAAIKIGKACAPVWYKFNPRLAELEYEFIGEDVSAGNNIQFRGSVIDHNSYHYSIPYAASFVVRTDPRDGSQTKYNVSHLSTSRQKWIDVVYASNKKIYAAPHSAKGILSINTEDPDDVIVDEVRYGYGLQCRGIALDDNGDGTGRGYLTTYSGSPVVRRFNFNDAGSDKPISHINYTYPYELDPYYIYRNNISIGSRTLAEDDCNTRAFMYRSFWGAVNGNNGIIYGIPYGSAFVMTIDTNNGDAVDFLTDYPLSGNADFSDKRWNQNYLYGASPQWGKYRGGVLTSNGAIYSFGTHARSVLKIDTVDNSVKEIPYPQEVIDKMVEGQSPSLSASIGKLSTSFFSYEGPDGKVYNTLWNVDMQLSIDPQTDTIGVKSLSNIINTETTGAGALRYTSGSTHNNTSFITPGRADKVLKINYPGHSPEPYPDVTPIGCVIPTPSPTHTSTPTPTPSTSMCIPPSNTPSKSMHVCPSTTPSASMCVQPSVTPSTSVHVCPSTTSTATPTNTPTNCVQPSQTPFPTYTSCATCTPTSTPSISQSVTSSPSISHSVTPTPSSTPSPSQSITATPTPSASRYPSTTPTPSISPSSSATPQKPVKKKKKKFNFWKWLLSLFS